MCHETRHNKRKKQKRRECCLILLYPSSPRTYVAQSIYPFFCSVAFTGDFYVLDPISVTADKAVNRGSRPCPLCLLIRQAPVLPVAVIRIAPVIALFVSSPFSLSCTHAHIINHQWYVLNRAGCSYPPPPSKLSWISSEASAPAEAQHESSSSSQIILLLREHLKPQPASGEKSGTQVSSWIHGTALFISRERRRWWQSGSQWQQALGLWGLPSFSSQTRQRWLRGTWWLLPG